MPCWSMPPLKEWPKPVKVAELPRMLTTTREPAGASMDSSVAPVKSLPMAAGVSGH